MTDDIEEAAPEEGPANDVVPGDTEEGEAPPEADEDEDNEDEE